MLNKTFVCLCLLAVSFASNASNKSTLTVAPNHPSSWGYMGATVTVNNNPPITVWNGVKFLTSPNEKLSLVVYAMNARPKLSDSCLHLQTQDLPSQLLFELKSDWQVHCEYRSVD
jgi:hypothetical protein